MSFQGAENEASHIPDPGLECDRKGMDPLLSEYSEFLDNDKSDISDLFEKHSRIGLRGQRTLSDDCGSIMSLSMDMDDMVQSPCPMSPVAKIVKAKSVEEDDETYASSSCSISIESDGDILRGHQITVPVTIEAPPPEHRVTARRELEKGAEGGSSDIHPAKLVKKALSVDAADEIRRVSGSIGVGAAANVGPRDMMMMDSSVPLLEPGMRMVLVRDIGVQVSGDSPNLNLNRRTHKKHQHHSHQQIVQLPGSNKKDSLTEQFPAEVLF